MAPKTIQNYHEQSNFQQQNSRFRQKLAANNRSKKKQQQMQTTTQITRPIKKDKLLKNKQYQSVRTKPK